MFRKVLAAFVIVLVAGAAVLSATSHAQKPGSGAAKPVAPGAGVQVGAVSDLTALGIDKVDRIEMQLKHEDFWDQPAMPGSTYSFSFVAQTDQGWILRMGEIVLQSDSWNHKRWFIQVLRPSGSGYVEHYWNLSRAGEANTPPASSCSSGDDTCSGMPYSVVLSNNTATFYFDWISKARVRVAGAGSKLTKVYFLGEVAGAAAGEVMGPRTALTTYRVWNGGPYWWEPQATAFYSGASGDCTYYGVDALGPSDSARSDGGKYSSLAAGTDVACETGILWPTSRPAAQ